MRASMCGRPMVVVWCCLASLPGAVPAAAQDGRGIPQLATVAQSPGPAPTGAPAAPTVAAPTAIDAGVYRIASSVLREDRTVRVVVPPHYAATTRRYPVLYVLDGDSNAGHAAEAARLLANHSRIPEMIVVGISHTRRNWELTTAPKPSWKYPAELGEVGGADRFLDALQTDIVPWVERTFRTHPHRTLLGHSLGGMVAWHVLATRPSLFQSYVIVDGSVFWNDGQVVDELEDALTSPAPPQARVFWVRDAIPHEVWFPENHRLKALVDRPPSAVTRITFHEEPNETHGTVVYPGTYLGLKALFADYRAEARPDWTITQIDEYYAALSRTYGFTVEVPRAVMAMVAHGLTAAGRTADAVGAWKRNVTTYPESLAARDDLALGLRLDGQPDAARTVQEEALALAARQGTPDVEVRRRAIAPSKQQ